MEVTVDGASCEAVGERNRHIAVHGIPLALEQAHLVLVLHREKLLLIDVGDHEGEAEERGARWMHALIVGGWQLIQLTDQPLLVPILRVASAHVNHPPVNIGLRGVDANTLPILQHARVPEVIPLLVPPLRVATAHLQLRELGRPCRSREAQAEVVPELSRPPVESPLLAQVLFVARPHLHAARQVGPLGRRQAMAALAFHDAAHGTFFELLAVPNGFGLRVSAVLVVVILICILVILFRVSGVLLVSMFVMRLLLLLHVRLRLVAAMGLLVLAVVRMCEGFLGLLGVGFGLVGLRLGLLRLCGLEQELGHLGRRAEALLGADAGDHARLVVALEGPIVRDDLQETDVGKAWDVALLAPRPRPAPGLQVAVLVALFNRRHVGHRPQHRLGPKVRVHLELVARRRLREVDLRQQLLVVLDLVMLLSVILVPMVHGPGNVVLGVLCFVRLRQLLAAEANRLVPQQLDFARQLDLPNRSTRATLGRLPSPPALVTNRTAVMLACAACTRRAQLADFLGRGVVRLEALHKDAAIATDLPAASPMALVAIRGPLLAGDDLGGRRVLPCGVPQRAEVCARPGLHERDAHTTSNCRHDKCNRTQHPGHGAHRTDSRLPGPCGGQLAVEHRPARCPGHRLLPQGKRSLQASMLRWA
mmetsp:Transcript_13867/g.39561  ORF Transcript_13867/g.39561 Transcript_13867/m.39561 type:complete len:648 (+) Transcript_13867:745-2688(+)